MNECILYVYTYLDVLTEKIKKESDMDTLAALGAAVEKLGRELKQYAGVEHARVHRLRNGVIQREGI